MDLRDSHRAAVKKAHLLGIPSCVSLSTINWEYVLASASWWTSEVYLNFSRWNLPEKNLKNKYKERTIPTSELLMNTNQLLISKQTKEKKICLEDKYKKKNWNFREYANRSSKTMISLYEKWIKSTILLYPMKFEKFILLKQQK